MTLLSKIAANKAKLNLVLLVICVTVISAFYLRGIAIVPFHPDESTQLFMSADLETLFRDPSSLFWQAEKQGDLRQHYREMDAPLARYLLGAGRLLAGVPAPHADWNWSLSWQQNDAAGALPDENLLWAGRLAVAALLPLTLLLVYSAGSVLAGTWAGWISMLLTASNALVLLHVRRAMAEGPLLFCAALALFCILRLKRFPWLTAIPVALAFNAKQTATALLVPALLALLWPAAGQFVSIRRRLGNIVLFGALFIGITFALDPVLWSHPLQAAESAVRERAEFTTRQQSELASVSSPLAPSSLSQRTVVDLVQMWFSDPAVYDVCNYRQDTQASEEAYFANPLNNLLRGIVGGLLMMVLSLGGFALGALQVVRQPDHPKRRVLLLLLSATLAQIVLALSLPVAFQRYYLPLVLYSNLWIGFLISQTKRSLTQSRKV